MRKPQVLSDVPILDFAIVFGIWVLGEVGKGNREIRRFWVDMEIRLLGICGGDLLGLG